MSAYSKSPLAMLVIVCAGLALARIIIGGIHYYTIDLPAQQALSAPANSGSGAGYGMCVYQCLEDNYGSDWTADESTYCQNSCIGK